VKAFPGSRVAAIGGVVAVLVWVERVPAGSGLRLSSIIVCAALALFAASVAVFGPTLRAAPADALCLGVTAWAAATPLLVLAAEAAGGIGRGAVLVGAAVALVALWPRKPKSPFPSPPDRPAPVPLSVYLLALSFSAWSVGGPFRFFSADSLVKELYTDGFQRFGTIYGLVHGLPPANPFVAGLPLRYYWFSLAPMAALWPRVDADLFVVWKSVLTWQAFAFVVSLWWVVHATFRSRVAAHGACLAAIVLPSWELLVHPRLRDLVVEGAGAVHGSFRPLVESLRAQDPDHLVGLLTPYSDQLLMEDFLYIPQNAAALCLFLVVLLLVGQRRSLAAVVLASAFVGTNAFFAIPAGAAAVLAVFVAEGALAGVLAGGVFTAWALLWGSFCAIVPAPPSAMAVLAAASTVGAVLLRRRVGARPATEAGPVALRRSATLFLLSVALVVVLRPGSAVSVLVLTYGPALVLATFFLVQLASRREAGPGEGGDALVFLLAFGSVFFVLTAVLAAPFWLRLPDWLGTPTFRLGDRINPFNFYHKVGKAVRLTWCILGGLSLASLWPWVTAGRRRRAAALGLAVVVLPAAAGVSLLRPVTYMRTMVPPEREAATYLDGRGASLDQVVLLEDVRRSQINQLAPVSTFFVSSWSNRDRSLTHAAGTWADQYVPPRFAGEVARREALNAAVFADPNVGAAIRRLLLHERIDWVLTRRRYDLGAGFRLVVDRRDGYLYEVLASGR
jgi:hypothetical protein